MKQVTGIQATGSQKLRIRLDDGRPVDLRITYRQGVQMWFVSLTFEGRTVNNLRLCANTNLLRQYRLPFGLLVGTVDGYEPTLINDFRDETCQFFVLNESDIEELSGILAEVFG